MRHFSLSNADPFCACLSADVRALPVSLDADQTWELALSEGESPAVRLQTTYGYQARRMQVYPAAGWDDTVSSDPARFHKPVRITALTPDFARMTFAPLEGLAAVVECFVPDPSVLLVRLTLTNETLTSHQARGKLYVDFLPDEGTGGMQKQDFNGAAILAGETDGLVPVLVACSGAVVQESAHPALVVRDRLDPNASRSWTFALATRSRFHDSVQLAREQCSLDWDSAIAALEQRTAAFLDIETGDPDWDAAIWMTQKEIFRHLISPTRRLPAAGFVTRRTPDAGIYSAVEAGAIPEGVPDAAEAYWLASQLMDVAPELAAGIVRNALSRQKPDGFIPARVGPAGRTSDEMCIPLLADLAWMAFERMGDEDIIREFYPGLKRYFEAWFSEQQDADQDGHPEWTSTFQAGFDRWPAFVRWQKWGQGLNIARAETMDLGAYLFREAAALKAMAAIVHDDEGQTLFEMRQAGLLQALDAGWQSRTSVYRHVDRDDHVSPRGKRICRGKGDYDVEIGGRYEEPVRLIFRIRCKEAKGKSIRIRIHGRGQRGRPRVERLKGSDFDWFWDYGVVTTEKTYKVLSRIEVLGVDGRCSSEVSIADFSREDQAQLLPLWAGMPAEDRAARMVAKTVLDPDRFWRAGGMPRCSAADKAYDPSEVRGCGGVSMLWSSMVGEGLLAYGYHEEAAELLTRLMGTAVQALQRDKHFSSGYNPDGGDGLHDRHHPGGVAPLSLFLRVVGVRLYSPRKVWVRGRHALPWPVTLRWKGLTLRLDPEGVAVTFPDGQTEEWAHTQAMMIEQLD